MPGSTPPTSQLDWLISTTEITVRSWYRATKDWPESFEWGISGKGAGYLRCQAVEHIGLRHPEPQPLGRDRLPQSAAGMRTEPPVSVPIATAAPPSLTDTAAPDKDPSGISLPIIRISRGAVVRIDAEPGEANSVFAPSVTPPSRKRQKTGAQPFATLFHHSPATEAPAPARVLPSMAGQMAAARGVQSVAASPSAARSAFAASRSYCTASSRSRAFMTRVVTSSATWRARAAF